MAKPVNILNNRQSKLRTRKGTQVYIVNGSFKYVCDSLVIKALETLERCEQAH